MTQRLWQAFQGVPGNQRPRPLKRGPELLSGVPRPPRREPSKPCATCSCLLGPRKEWCFPVLCRAWPGGQSQANESGGFPLPLPGAPCHLEPLAPHSQATSSCPIALCHPVSLASLLCWIYKALPDPLPTVKLPSSPLLTPSPRCYPFLQSSHGQE